MNFRGVMKPKEPQSEEEDFQKLAIGVRNLLRIMHQYILDPSKKELKKKAEQIFDRVGSASTKIGGTIAEDFEKLKNPFLSFLENPTKEAIEDVLVTLERLHNELKNL